MKARSAVFFFFSNPFPPTSNVLLKFLYFKIITFSFPHAPPSVSVDHHSYTPLAKPRVKRCGAFSTG